MPAALRAERTSDSLRFVSFARRASEKPIRLDWRRVSTSCTRTFPFRFANIFEEIAFSRSTICWSWSRNQGSIPVMRKISSWAHPRSRARLT